MPVPVAIAVDAVTRFVKKEPLIIISAVVSLIVYLAGLLHIGLDHATVEEVVAPLLAGALARFHVNSKYTYVEDRLATDVTSAVNAVADADPDLAETVKDEVSKVEEEVHHQLSLGDIKPFATPVNITVSAPTQKNKK